MRFPKCIENKKNEKVEEKGGKCGLRRDRREERGGEIERQRT